MSFNIYSYDEIEQRLRVELEATEHWKNLVGTQAVSVIAKIVARFGQLMSNELLAVVRDFYPTTSMSESAIMKFARFVNYEFQRAISSNGKIKIQLSTVPSNPVYIPATWIAETKDKVVVSIEGDAYINPPEDSIILDVVQGTWEEIIRVSDGSANYKININDLKVDHNKFTVYVDGSPWTKAQSNVFSYSTSDDEVYITRVLLTGTRVQFGNGTFGKKPPVTQEIKIVYLATDGSDGEILTTIAGTLSSKIALDDGGEDVTYSVEVDEIIAGGTPRETIKNVAYNIPRYLTTSGGVISQKEYIDKLRLYTDIIDANVWSATIDGTDATTMNLIYLSVVPVGGGFLTSTEKQNILDDFYLIHPVPNRLGFQNPEYVKVITEVSARSNGSVSNDTLKANIETKCNDLMNFSYRVETLKETIFGTLYHWRFIKEIATINGLDVTEGVSGDLHVTLKIKDDIFTTVVGVTSYAISTQMANIIPGSMIIYDESFNQLATTDSDGNFSGATITSGSINFTTGAGNIKFTSEPTGVVIAVYELVEGTENLVTQDVNQVFEIYQADVIIQT